MTPYYEAEGITLYCGDFRVYMPEVPYVDAVITDPPYNETKLAWDVWPASWPTMMAAISHQLWCFGSMRMFLDRRDEFVDWRFEQDLVWEKHNGSNMAADRFKRVHELALHFVRGPWGDLPLEPQYTADATARQVRRKQRPPQWGEIGASVYTSVDGGPRLMRSVQYVRSCHGYATNETQKPEGIIEPILRYSVPRNGIVFDPFAGSGTTLVVARREGRRAIGCELREAQCAQIVERLAQRELPFLSPRSP